MKKMGKYGKLAGMTAAALGMTAALTLEGASAYFTTYVSAGGSQVVRLGSSTEIHEDVSQMTKHISIENASAENDCFVRVKVFYGGDLEVVYSDTENNWYEGEAGYWYYRPILPAAQTTTGLDVKINVPEGYDRDSFNVVVIQECTPVVFDETGNPTADWSTVYSEYEEVSEGEGADNS
ncbi:MAG: hypothetical protein HFI15_11800 [Lachnospiraceae bacterium]|jgi:hypothetical protein|nr:hypothetical protein [Lachnospiraceae bacterium]